MGAPVVPPDESNEAEVPGYRNYLIYTDESGMHRADYYGFGSLWIPWERRGELTGGTDALRALHNYTDELKWKKQSRFSEPFARAVIDYFFLKPWLMFHCVLIRKAAVRRELHVDRD